MDYYGSYFNQINQIIGQNGRYARQILSNQQNGQQTGTSSGSSSETSSGTTGGSTGTLTGTDSLDYQSQMMNSLNPMLMLMMFQMMDQMMSNLGNAAGSGASTSMQANPATTPYIPGLTGNVAPTQSSTQNPAYLALDNRLNQKAVANAEQETVSFDDADIAAIRGGLQDGLYTPAALGQALKAALAESPEANLPAISRTITDLSDSGELNAAPFLQNDYLQRLSPERKEVLLQAMETSGLRMDNGRANSRLIGFMLETLAKPGDSESKALCQRFLQDFYDVHGATSDTPVGQILAQTLNLAGVTADEAGKLQFPA